MKQVHEDDREIVFQLDLDWKKGPWVAGGAPLQWYQNKPIDKSDIDIYFKDERSFNKLFKKLAPQEFPDKKAKLDLFNFGNKNVDFEIKYKSDNAVSLLYKGTHRVQLIKKRFYDTPEEIISDFDISVCQVVTDGYKIYFAPGTVKDINEKNLRIVNMRPEVIKRYIKYQAYGYKPVSGTLDLICDTPDIDDKFEKSVKEEDYEY